MSSIQPKIGLRTRAPLAVASAGAAVAAFGLFRDPERTWLNLLVGGFYLLSLAISGTFFIASQLVSGSRWSAGLRRIPEAVMLLLPVGALLAVGVFLGRKFIYPWSRAALAHGDAVAGRTIYLTPRFVLVRMVVAVTVWCAFVWLLRRTSLDQDLHPKSGLVYHRRLVRYASAFLVVFAPSFTMASYDWVLSLEPQWFSTMFAVYVFAGMMVVGFAAVTLAVVLLEKRGMFPQAIDPSQLHDLGKLLFAFSTFWAYIWLCQYLLIWYGNIPEEVTYYVRRTSGPWLVVFTMNVIVNWVVPFVFLMSARAKRNRNRLLAVAGVLLLGHWLDLYLMVMPAKRETPVFGVYELAIAAAYASLAYVIVVRALFRAPLVPVNDPIVTYDRRRGAHGHA